MQKAVSLRSCPEVNAIDLSSCAETSTLCRHCCRLRIYLFCSARVYEARHVCCDLNNCGLSSVVAQYSLACMTPNAPRVSCEGLCKMDKEVVCLYPASPRASCSPGGAIGSFTLCVLRPRLYQRISLLLTLIVEPQNFKNLITVVDKSDFARCSSSILSRVLCDTHLVLNSSCQSWVEDRLPSRVSCLSKCLDHLNLDRTLCLSSFSPRQFAWTSDRVLRYA